MMLKITTRAPRWYYAHVDLGPEDDPLIVAIEGSSPEDVRAKLLSDFADRDIAASIGEIGLLADLPEPDEADDDLDARP